MKERVETIAAEGGMYSSYKFNDEYLRKLGLRCEEFFPERDIPTVLRSLARDAKGYEGRDGFKAMILKAEDVLETPSNVKEGTYALYLPPRGIEAQRSSSCTDLSGWDGSPENHPFKKGGSGPHPNRR